MPHSRRLPVQPRIHPVEAARIVTDNILPHFEVVSLGNQDYLEALNTRASSGWIGAKICDALGDFKPVGAGRSATKNMRALRSKGKVQRRARHTGGECDLADFVEQPCQEGAR